ncbi:MAG: hypothetical protein ACI8XB_001494 [Patiriisocius sp.]|jgi:hypothetical protein
MIIMKKLNILLILGIVIIVCTSQVMAQVHNAADRNNISVKIPDRFQKIGQEGMGHIYKDPKINAVFFFEKIDTYDIENLLGDRINLDMEKYLSNPNYTNIIESKINSSLGKGHVIDLEKMDDDGQLSGKSQRLILIDINGTIYRFAMMYETENHLISC